MKQLEVEFSTHELQLAVIACINAKYAKDSITHDEENQKTMDELIEKFGELNRWCYSGNDYTIKVTVSA